MVLPCEHEPEGEEQAARQTLCYNSPASAGTELFVSWSCPASASRKAKSKLKVQPEPLSDRTNGIVTANALLSGSRADERQKGRI